MRLSIIDSKIIISATTLLRMHRFLGPQLFPYTCTGQNTNGSKHYEEQENNPNQFQIPQTIKTAKALIN